MPLIKPRTTRTTLVRHITQLFTENHEELYAYAQFIHESSAYVLNELVETLKKDADFRAWRADHPASYVPVPGLWKTTRRHTPAAHARTSAGRAGMTALPPSA
jgi:hypothetical protein